MKIITYELINCSEGNSYKLDSVNSVMICNPSVRVPSGTTVVKAGTLPSSGTNDKSYCPSYLNVILTDSSKEFKSANCIFGGVNYIFKKGLGLIRAFSEISDGDPDFLDSNYVYYKVGNKLFGQRPDFSRSITGINENSTVKKVEISPNPFSDYSIISLSNINEKLDLIITDINGKEMLTEKIDMISSFYKINGKDYLPGVYFYKILGNSGLVKSGKLVIL